jgi:hypothetical protein
MKRVLTSLVLACSLTLSPACAVTSKLLPAFLVKPPSPVQIVVAADHAVEAANKLGEIVLQLSASAHKMKLANALPVEADNAVQRAAIAFADAKDGAVAGFNKAATGLQLIAAGAPLVGSAESIMTTMSNVQAQGLTGTAGLLAGQLPDLLKKGREYIATLGGK